MKITTFLPGSSLQTGRVEFDRGRRNSPSVSRLLMRVRVSKARIFVFAVVRERVEMQAGEDLEGDWAHSGWTWVFMGLNGCVGLKDRLVYGDYILVQQSF